MNKKKQWSLDETHYSHRYETIRYGDQHSNFYAWLSSGIFSDKVSILDIGGGNGNVIVPIIASIKRYLCLDLNQKNVEFGSSYFKLYPNVEFRRFDVDEDPFDNENFDISYVDSVFHMVEDPWKLLSNLISRSNYVFLNRTFCRGGLEKKSHKWGGMTNPSTLWQFDWDFFLNFKSTYGCDILNGDGYIIVESSSIKNPSSESNDYLEKYKKELIKDISECTIFG